MLHCSISYKILLVQLFEFRWSEGIVPGYAQHIATIKFLVPSVLDVHRPFRSNFNHLLIHKNQIFSAQVLVAVPHHNTIPYKVVSQLLASLPNPQ
ncbi:hypothetical protein S83_028094 [Arachis hypogaea]